MASLDAGRRLADRYVLKERLGDGGHAEVWSALDERTGQVRALKFLHLSTTSADEAMPVLQHESRMARNLEHPGVLQVDEPLRDGDLVFLPVEYAPGGGAAKLRGAPWRRVVPVLLEVARVLQHVHGRGQVHRDIKPGNVLFDAAGRVRVADFGTSAHAGTCDAPANGSPFSASPQQLRGEPASPPDDVYGLGALTHELLTRYPPFYPQFDAVRVQEQDPPRPVPVHPAPAELLDLVQAMLARDAAQRPTLEAVIAEFERCLALPLAPGEDAVMIEAAPVRAAASAARTRSVPVWWWLAVAITAGAVVLVLLPEPRRDAAVTTVAPVEREITSVADAVVAVPAPAPAPAPAERAPVPTARDEVLAGKAALAALRPAQARAAFQRALALQADHADALAGLTTAALLDVQLADLANGSRAEAGGAYEHAREHYRALLAEYPDFTPARTALARIDSRLLEEQFEDHLAAAAAALRGGRVEEAVESYAGAAAIHPGDARVLDGQQRIAEIQRDRQNAADLAAGARLESGEQWTEAVAHYRAVLQREANLRFATDGLARSERRAALDRELADYIARAERLTAEPVRRAAQLALARGEASAAGSPRLTTQLAALRAVLASLEQPVNVALTSDNSTSVTVTRVGELGTFQSRELTLPPGQYTVIGRREGFRDVYVELNLAPGQRSTALSVRCTERI